MLRIRLARRGKKRNPSYRVVVAEIEAPRDGRFVEQIGFYNPMVDPIDYRIQEARALHWLNVGAQPSDAVRRLLDKQGTFERLSRLRAGEPAEKLVAEFEGTPWPPVEETVAEEVVEAVAAPIEEAAAVVADVVEAVEEVAADVVESASEAVESATEVVADVAEAAAETVADAVEAVVDADADTEEAA